MVPSLDESWCTVMRSAVSWCTSANSNSSIYHEPNEVKFLINIGALNRMVEFCLWPSNEGIASQYEIYQHIYTEIVKENRIIEPRVYANEHIKLTVIKFFPTSQTKLHQLRKIKRPEWLSWGKAEVCWPAGGQVALLQQLPCGAPRPGPLNWPSPLCDPSHISAGKYESPVGQRWGSIRC